VVRGLGNPGPIIVLSPPAEAAAVCTTLWLPTEAAAVGELRFSAPATIFPSPAEAAAVFELGIPGPATALPPPAKAAAARELGVPRSATALPPPAEASATHGAAKTCSARRQRRSSRLAFL